MARIVILQELSGSVHVGLISQVMLLAFVSHAHEIFKREVRHSSWHDRPNAQAVMPSCDLSTMEQSIVSFLERQSYRVPIAGSGSKREIARTRFSLASRL